MYAIMRLMVVAIGGIVVWVIHSYASTPTSMPRSQRVDRFVAPRDSFDSLRRRQHVFQNNQRSPHIWFGKYMSQKKYASHIDKAFGLETRTRSEKGQSWPCVPRKKCYLSSADNILDLPTYGSAPFPELLDWSSDDILVAALGTNYYKWSWNSQSPIGKGITLFKTACCRFDPSGEKLALGTDMQRVEIHNSWSKWVSGSWCRCASFDQPYCQITAIDWSPTGNSFVSGCSRGMVTVYDRDAVIISSQQVTFGPVLHIRVSPDARYVAAVAVNSSKVLVMLWPMLKDSKAILSDWIVKTIAWHPWRSALLGIGGVTQEKSWVCLWDAPRACIRATTTVSDSNYSLDTMLFSHRTGELVMSLWNTESQFAYSKACCQLVVMSGPDMVVDQWGDDRQGIDRVRTMVFSPDGTKLATATADEDLIIWNFLPEDNQTSKKTKRKSFSAIPTFLDKSIQGFSVR